MSSIAKDLFDRYRKFVTNNSESVGHLESAARVLSYVAPGGSAALSELLSSTVSLVVFLNDYILRKAANINLDLPAPTKQLGFCLTVLENVEVFLELAAYEKRGDRTRWLIVVTVQIVKCILRLLLLLKFEAGITSSPPIPSLKRDKAFLAKLRPTSTQQIVAEEKNTERIMTFESDSNDNNSNSFILKSSGRLVRSLNSDSLVKRSWTSSTPSVPSDKIPRQQHSNLKSTPLNERQVLAECLHIIRPLVHLSFMYICGQSSWKPWLIACGVDLSSLYLTGSPENLNPVEKEELKRRAFMMLLYLLRSPFYDRFSRVKLLFFLGYLAQNVPVVRLIIRPLLEFLPLWQKIYFYVWTT